MHVKKKFPTSKSLIFQNTIREALSKISDFSEYCQAEGWP